MSDVLESVSHRADDEPPAAPIKTQYELHEEQRVIFCTQLKAELRRAVNAASVYPANRAGRLEFVLGWLLQAARLPDDAREMMSETLSQGAER